MILKRLQECARAFPSPGGCGDEVSRAQQWLQTGQGEGEPSSHEVSDCKKPNRTHPNAFARSRQPLSAHSENGTKWYDAANRTIFETLVPGTSDDSSVLRLISPGVCMGSETKHRRIVGSAWY